MELLFAIVIGAALGLGARYALRGRRTHGVLVLPAIAAAVTAIVWVALVWAGLRFDGGWIWTISLVAGALAAIVAGVVIPRVRTSADAAFLERARRA